MYKKLDAEFKKIEREYGRLVKCFSEYDGVKKQIAVLMDKSSSDPRAKEKLEAFMHQFPQGIDGLEQETKKGIKELSIEMKKLESSIKHTIEKK